MKKELKNQMMELRKDVLEVEEARKTGILNAYVEDTAYMDLGNLAFEHPELMKEVIKEEIEILRKEVSNHDKLYSQNKPVLTDSDYDELYLRLEKLEKENPEFFDANSPTQKIITTIVDNLKKVKHTEPMLSQQKINNKQGLLEFLERGNGDVLVQQKLDGITLVLKYSNGELIQAVTRGDGEEGEDLYHNVIHFDNVPKKIGFQRTLEIRTEAVLPFADFEKMNTHGEYSNPRNLVSGSLRQLDSSNVVGKGFKAIAFDLIVAEGQEFSTDSEKLKFMQQLGFEVVDSTLFGSTSAEAIFDYINNYENVIRESLEHMIDGIVLKFDDSGLREDMGYTSKHPRWATAYKFKSMDATTKLLGITDQVGKTGQITPVAELETVNIEGVNISRATLHNYANIESKDIRIGDTVLIERANDVIPQVVQSIKDLRDGSQVFRPVPSNCPICNSITEFDGANLYCTGINCTPQIEGKLKHFASRDAMNIDGMGDKTVEEFFNKGIITSIVDIYSIKVKKEEILKLEGFGEKKFERIVKGVEDSKSRELRNFIYGLSIKNIGRSASRDLAVEFRSMENILKASEDSETFKAKLLTVGIFGEVMSQNLIDFLDNQDNLDVINKLISLGLTSELQTEVVDVASQATNSSIFDKVFVVTGKVSEFKNRKELQEKIEELGGKVTGSVSRNTNYLINNDKESTSSKNKQAKKLEIPIISEEDFINLIR